MTETELLTLARPTIHKAYMAFPETVQEACEIAAHDAAQKRLNQ